MGATPGVVDASLVMTGLCTVDPDSGGRMRGRQQRRSPPGGDRRVALRGRRSGRRITRRILWALAVVVALLVGYVAYFYWDLSVGVTTSDAINHVAARSTDGSANILLIGLDSRKDQGGKPLPPQILDQLHAGDGNEGGYNTNTLILMHIPARDGPVTAFSIPRDDYVDIPGEHKDKIKKAYGYAKAKAETILHKQGITDQHTLETRSREAGRQATVTVVHQLTGVPIDHLAEVNLAGFYDLADALDGIKVCLNHPVDDPDYSGAHFPAGPQTLTGAQALAFVRQRHGLANGDLDRTHRQQALLASVSHQLHNPLTLANPITMHRLVDVTKKDLVVDSDWGLIGYARQTPTLTSSGTLQFQTLPITSYGKTRSGEDINIINPTQIQHIVQTTFANNTPPPTTHSPQPPPTSPQDNPINNSDVPCVN